jgi:hypothetical protein
MVKSSRLLQIIALLFSLNLTLVLDGTAQVFSRLTLSDDNGWTEGGNWIDYDSDGDLDLFLPNNRRSPNSNFLYRNDGGDVFTKVDTGIIATDVVMTESGTWGDYDNDGDLDLFVADGGFDRARFNSLYRNEGGGHFIEITTTPLSSELSFSTSSGWADYDNDGDLDLYCANLQLASNPSQSTSPDFLYQNNGDGTFSKITSGVITTTLTRSFGIGWSDYDNDNDVDLFVCNGSGNILYRNSGGGNFTRMTLSQVGAIASDGGGLACSWGDYNNDGFQDLFVGRFGANDLLYLNDGDGTFTKITTGPVVTNSSAQAEGSAWGDYDYDGDLDLFMGNFSGKTSYIFRNEHSGNNWFRVEAVGTVSNRTAIGAKVRVKATFGGQAVWQLREISGQIGYNAQNSLYAHFGLGDAPQVDSLKIEWPSGTIDLATNLDVNQFITATEGQPITSVQGAEPNLPQEFALRQNYPNPFNPTTTIQYHLPTAAWVTLRIYNILGHEIRTLVHGSPPGGTQMVVWDGKNDLGQAVSSGVYVYRLEATGTVITRKMLLLR